MDDQKRFVVAIEPGTCTQVFGVIVPDLTGCFSAGNSILEALANAREAIELHLEQLSTQGLAQVVPRSIELKRL